MTTRAHRPAQTPYADLVVFLAVLATGVILISWPVPAADQTPLLATALSTLYAAWHAPRATSTG
ncbi:hypothetical protein [Streptomyces sp. NRRL B-1347]|uniref:hypothetical protein n=1 Tax=Streptomyces sp. NRRL B-1347 TaxID=1476877 RepID=UPI0004C8EB3E|nr:hypothetical protein [Streptomyces sp. NRRL B-1347]